MTTNLIIIEDCFVARSRNEIHSSAALDYDTRCLTEEFSPGNYGRAEIEWRQEYVISSGSPIGRYVPKSSIALGTNYLPWLLYLKLCHLAQLECHRETIFVTLRDCHLLLHNFEALGKQVVKSVRNVGSLRLH